MANLTINLTNEQTNQIKWQLLNDYSLRELIGEVITRLSVKGDLDLLNVLCEYQKSLSLWEA